MAKRKIERLYRKQYEFWQHFCPLEERTSVTILGISLIVAFVLEEWYEEKVPRDRL